MRRSLHICIGVVLVAHAILVGILATRLPGRSGLTARSPSPRLVLVSIGQGSVASASTLPGAAPRQAQATAAMGNPPNQLPDRQAPIAATARPASSPASVSRKVAAQPAPDRTSVAPDQFFESPERVDIPSRPRSEPDIALIQGLSWSGVPMRLRLFVDARGTVVDVHVLQSSDLPDVVERVRRMFLSTGFVPARMQGADVASYKDIEINIGPPL